MPQCVRRSEHNFTELVLSFHLSLGWNPGLQAGPQEFSPTEAGSQVHGWGRGGPRMQCQVFGLGMFQENPPEFVKGPSFRLAITEGLMDQVCLLVNSKRSRGFS